MSGNPIKSLGSEMIPSFDLIDPYFDEEAKQTFKEVFGVSVPIALDIINNRLGNMMYRKTRKEVLNLPNKIEIDIKVKIPNGERFTIDSVRDQIQKFSKEREDYYKKNFKQYYEDYEQSLYYFEKNCLYTKTDKTSVTIQKTAGWEDYRKDVTYLRKHGYNYQNPDSVKRGQNTNKFEKEYIIPCLTPQLKKKFIKAKSVVKYVNLTIMGEVIGGLLNKLRAEMSSEIIKYSSMCELISKAKKKTVCFSTFVDTVEQCNLHVKKTCKLNPILVYGKTSKDIPKLLESFKTDNTINPLIATVQTLSTGVTLVEANTVIFINKPWRYTDYIQASDRVYRIGQDTDVTVYTLILDTGTDPNLSTRIEEIVTWSKEMFEGIVGKDEVEKAIYKMTMNSKKSGLFDLLRNLIKDRRS